MIINFFKVKPNMGMKANGLSYSNINQGKLFLFRIVEFLFNCLIIPYIIQFFNICFKKGTWAEKWAENYKIVGKDCLLN